MTNGLADFEDSVAGEGVESGSGEELFEGGEEGGVATEVEDTWRLDGAKVTPKFELLQNGQVETPFGAFT
jgi:hypothetical protein